MGTHLNRREVVMFGTRVTAASVVRTSAYYNSGNFRSPDGAKSHLTRFIYVSLLTQNCKSKLNRKREKRKKLIWGPFIKYQISHTSGHKMQIPTPGMDFARKNT